MYNSKYVLPVLSLVSLSIILYATMKHKQDDNIKIKLVRHLYTIYEHKQHNGI
jgi:hypothetical protein